MYFLKRRRARSAGCRSQPGQLLLQHLNVLQPLLVQLRMTRARQTSLHLCAAELLYFLFVLLEVELHCSLDEAFVLAHLLF
jgi:hypothetical protein